MSEEMKRLLTEAVKKRRPVLVNPTEAELGAAAERLRAEGKLICTNCRQPIAEESYVTRRINYTERIQALAHLHVGCADSFAVALDEGEQGQ